MGESYIPALRFHVLTPFFDPFMDFALPDREIKRDLVERARLRDGARVLDFGCGTATLTILIKRRYPGAFVRGLDVDEAILAKARRKAWAGEADVGFDIYDGGRFPYPDGSFDRVVTCFVLHHLDNSSKKSALQEIGRVLGRGAELYVTDFDRARNPFRKLAFEIVRLLDGRRNTRAHATGTVRKMIAVAGFEDVVEVARYSSWMGEVTCIRGTSACSRHGIALNSAASVS